MPKIGRSATTCSLSSRRCSARNGQWKGNFELPLRGIPLPVSVGKNAPGEERLSPPTSIFVKTLVAQNFGRRDARCKRWRHLLGARGARFWG